MSKIVFFSFLKKFFVNVEPIKHIIYILCHGYLTSSHQILAFWESKKSLNDLLIFSTAFPSVIGGDINSGLTSKMSKESLHTGHDNLDENIEKGKEDDVKSY